MPPDTHPTQHAPAAAELRTSRPTPRPPHPDDPRIGIAANAIGWELHRRDRNVTEHGDGNAQITVTAAEAAADRTIAERVVAHLDGYAAEPDAALPQIAEALVIRPGDILIVRVPTGTTAAAGAALKQQLAEHLPGIEAKVIAAEQLAAYRPEADQ